MNPYIKVLSIREIFPLTSTKKIPQSGYMQHSRGGKEAFMRFKVIFFRPFLHFLCQVAFILEVVFIFEVIIIFEVVFIFEVFFIFEVVFIFQVVFIFEVFFIFEVV